MCSINALKHSHPVEKKTYMDEKGLFFPLHRRSIRCLRNIIHWNLITTFILRNVMWFLLQLIDHNIHESNEVTPLAWRSGWESGVAFFFFNFDCFLFQPWCRLITTIYNYFVVTNFFWMFVEGCYLHTAIVMTYSTDKLRKWVFLFIGWCECVRVDSPLWTLMLVFGGFAVCYTNDTFCWRMEAVSVKPTIIQPWRCVSIKVWWCALWDYANLLHKCWWEAVWGKEGCLWLQF